MRRRIAALLTIMVVALVLAGPARQMLPGGLQLRSDGGLAPGGSGSDVHPGSGSAGALAPAPVTEPAANAARLVVTAEPAKPPEDGYVLSVTVRAPDGKPLANRPVKFYDIVDLIGPREMLVASATTDGSGAASYEYLPPTTGARSIVVRSSANGTVRAGEGRTTLDARVAAPQWRSEPRPLASFSDRVPYAVGIVVLGVWALIAFALFGTALGIRAGASTTRGKEVKST